MKNFLFAIFAIILPIISFGQINPYTEYNMSNSGISSNNITDVILDASGNKWMTSDNGLVKFDGVSWTIYNTSNSTLPTNNLLNLKIDASNIFWISSASGLIKFNGANFTTYNTGNSAIPSNNVRNLDFDLSGNVWIATTVGLSKFDGSVFTTFNTGNSGIFSNVCLSVCADAVGNIWIGHNTNISKFDGTLWTTLTNSMEGNPVSAVIQIEEDLTGKIFFKGNALFQFDAGILSMIGYDNANQSNYVNIYIHTNNDKWFVSGQNCFQFNLVFIDEFSLQSGNIKSMTIDAFNDAWLASGTKGLIQIDPTNGNCIRGTDTDSLNINNVKAKFKNDGTLWFTSNALPGYEFPKGSNSHSIYAGTIWVGGETENGQLRLAVNQFNQITDYFAGPLDHFSLTDTIQAADCDDFNKIWKIHRSTIDSFSLGLFAITPDDIKYWPGKNNPYTPFVGNREMAPFFDSNQDYNYNPDNGDYPLIKGDQSLWWIFNDGKGQHQSGTLPIGIEVQMIAYSYQSSDVLNNTTFYEVKITNKSDSILKNTNFTAFIDPDLGCYQDDYIGCDSTRNLGYVYNSDAFDENCLASTNGYGTNIPLVGINMLMGPKDEFREPVKLKSLFSFENSVGVLGIPNSPTPNVYFNFMNGIWSDGTHMVKGGNGHVSGGGTIPTNYIFPSNPSDPAGWSECTAGNVPGDRRLLITYGEFNLIPNQTNAITFSVVTVPNAGGLCADVNPLFEAVDSVKLFFDSTYCADFEIELTNVTNTTCLDSLGSSSVFASGGTPPYFYDWTSGSITNQTDNLSAGQYVVTVTDVLGCTNFISFNITDTDGPQITQTTSPTTCFDSNDGAINISVTGGNSPYSYLWSTNETTQDIASLQPGPYEITVTDANGCKGVKTINVSNPAEIIISSIISEPTCTNSNGAINITSTGGFGAYDFNWSNGPTTEDISSIAAGLYILIINDANNCSDTIYFAINDQNAPDISVVSVTPSSCPSNNSGAIDISVNGGNPGYTFLWTDSSTSEDISGLSAGIYGVEVTDASNCVASIFVNVDPIFPSVQELCLVSVDTTINANIIGWERLTSTTIDHYNIYRESSSPGIYFEIGQVPYDSSGIYIDSVADPNVKSWRYKITAVDDCGNESEPSLAQKTIHLSLSNNVNSILLAWDHYEGFAFDKYFVYRFTAGSGWIVLDSLPTNYTYYYDYTAPASEYVAYSIQVYRADSCLFDQTRANNQSQNSSRSNKKGIQAPINSIGEMIKPTSILNVFPNPNNGRFNLSISSIETGDYQLSIYSMDGREIKNQLLKKVSNTFNTEIDLEDYSDGIYLIRVFSKNEILNAKIIKQ